MRTAQALPFVIAGSALAICASIGGAAVFLAFVNIPVASWEWGLVGRGADPLNVHRVLCVLPGSALMVAAVASLLVVARRREISSGRVTVSRALLGASLALAPLAAAPVALLWSFIVGRIALGASAVGLVAYLSWPLLRHDVELLRRAAVRHLGCVEREAVIAVALALASSILLFAASVLRYRSHWASLVDLGLFYELFEGGGPGLLYSPTLGHSFLGEHFSPVLILLWPLMKLLPSPVTLLAVQAGAVGVGAVVLWLWARERTRHFGLALALEAAWCLSPLVQQGVLFDFHMDLVEPPLLFGAMLALHRRRMWGVWVCSILLWLTKEDTFLYTSAIAVYAIAFERRRALGAALLVAGLAQGLFVMGWLLPHMRPGPIADHFATVGRTGHYAFLTRYAYLGKTPAEIVRNVLLAPHVVLLHLATGSRLASLAMLILPFGGLAIAGRGRIVLLAPVLEMLLASSMRMTDLLFHYGAVAVMFGALAAVEGARELVCTPGGRVARGVLHWSPGRMALALGAVTAALVALHPSSWLSDHYDYQGYARLPHHERAEALMDRVPDGASVSATGYLAVHMFGRGRSVSLFPFGADGADRVLVDLQRPPWPRKYHDVQSKLIQLVRTGRFRIEELDDGLVLLARAPAGSRPDPAELLRLRNFLDEPIVEAELTEVTRFRSRIVRAVDASGGAYASVGPNDRRGPGHIVWGPYAVLTPGAYRAVARVRWSPAGPFPLEPGWGALTVDVRTGGRVVGVREFSVESMRARLGAWFEVSIPFMTKDTRDHWEVRVFHHDVGRLDLDFVRILRAAKGP